MIQFARYCIQYFKNELCSYEWNDSKSFVTVLAVVSVVHFKVKFIPSSMYRVLHVISAIMFRVQVANSLINLRVRYALFVTDD